MSVSEKGAPVVEGPEPCFNWDYGNALGRLQLKLKTGKICKEDQKKIQKYLEPFIDSISDSDSPISMDQSEHVDDESSGLVEAEIVVGALEEPERKSRKLDLTPTLAFFKPTPQMVRGLIRLLVPYERHLKNELEVKEEEDPEGPGISKLDQGDGNQYVAQSCQEAVVEGLKNFMREHLDSQATNFPPNNEMILGAVMAYLDPDDLAACRLVSKLWKQAANSALQKTSLTITLDKIDLPKFCRVMETSLEFPFRRVAVDLYMKTTDFYRDAARFFGRFGVLVIHLEICCKLWFHCILDSSGAGPHNYEEVILHALRNGDLLESLHLIGLSHEFFSESFAQDLKSIQLLRLKKLRIDQPWSLKADLIDGLIGLGPNIDNICIDPYVHYEEDSERMAVQNSTGKSLIFMQALSNQLACAVLEL